MILSNLPLVYHAAKAAGFTGSSLIMAMAIAAAESGFNPNAMGDMSLEDYKWGPSIGLMQIRSLKPDYLYLDPYRDAAQLPDPLFNMQAAFSISQQGTDFSAWTTYGNGAYQDYLDVVNAFLGKQKLKNIAFVALSALGVAIAMN